MDIALLGRFSVTVVGQTVVPSAPKPRQLLAQLASRANQALPVATLIEELWGETPPRSARTTLHTYVLQLRGLIGKAVPRGGDDSGIAKHVLETLPGGYRLDTDGGAVDFLEFETRAAAGYRAMDSEDFTAAARLLRDALSLWTAPALSGVRAGPHLRVEINRMEEARLCALERRIEADLRLGRHRELLSELTLLVDQYPTHESLHGHYILALHRSGRRCEALHAYQRLRATLIGKLGLEPSQQLQRLQLAILSARPAPAAAHMR
ncbi:AfsR/SARP family transcriptional regulator [Streptomyces phaeochromogenes]